MSGSKYVRAWGKGAAVFLAFVLSVVAGMGLGVGVGELVYRLAIASDPPVGADDLETVEAILDGVGWFDALYVHLLLPGDVEAQRIDVRDSHTGDVVSFRWERLQPPRQYEIERIVETARDLDVVRQQHDLSGITGYEVEAVRRWHSAESRGREGCYLIGGGLALLVVLAGWVGALVVGLRSLFSR